MVESYDEQFIDGLRSNIETKNKLKLQTALAHFDSISDDTQRIAIDIIQEVSDPFIFQVLVGCLASLDQDDGGHPLREVLFSKGLDNPDTVINLLRREAKPRHRILLADIVGEIKLESATPVLLAILNEAQDERVLRGVIAALGMIGDSSATTPLSEFLYSGSVELIIAAIQALGQLGNPTALQRLAQKLGADQDLDMMILDVFSHCQEPEALEQLNATLSAQQAHIRNKGKQQLIDIGPKVVPVLIKNLSYDDPDFVIHTINVLGILGDESAIAPLRKLLHNCPKDPNVRFAAYEALGQLPIAKGAFALAQGLNDSVEIVRSAAASAINHNYNTVLAAGIKNMIRDEDPVERPISRTIIDAQCDTMVLDLIQQESFSGFLVAYLSRQAHGDTRTHYIDLLRKHHLEKIADAIEGRTEIEPRPLLKVFAVDDSKMILNIYRSVLHNLRCEPMLFEFPALAIEAVKRSKPDLIFTDLNMPGINGIDLIKIVRRLYAKAELPIVMVTTQNECQDNEAAYKAGVNAILHKPFNERDLKEAMAGYLRQEAA